MYELDRKRQETMASIKRYTTNANYNIYSMDVLYDYSLENVINVTRRFVRVINGELISPFMDLRACRSPRTARIERKYGALSDHEKGLKCKN